MNPLVLSIVGLRAAALATALAGDSRASNYLYTLSDLLESGQATDAHMQAVADMLKTRAPTADDWNALEARIAADRAALHGN